MSVREEERPRNSSTSRGLGFAAAAIGVGVGAALYYMFSKRQERPDSEGSTSENWTAEPHVLTKEIEKENNSSPELDYTTVSQHTNTDTSVHDSEQDTNQLKTKMYRHCAIKIILSSSDDDDTYGNYRIENTVTIGSDDSTVHRPVLHRILLADEESENNQSDNSVEMISESDCSNEENDYNSQQKENTNVITVDESTVRQPVLHSSSLSVGEIVEVEESENNHSDNSEEIISDSYFLGEIVETGSLVFDVEMSQIEESESNHSDFEEDEEGDDLDSQPEESSLNETTDESVDSDEVQSTLEVSSDEIEEEAASEPDPHSSSVESFECLDSSNSNVDSNNISDESIFNNTFDNENNSVDLNDTDFNNEWEVTVSSEDVPPWYRQLPRTELLVVHLTNMFIPRTARITRAEEQARIRREQNFRERKWSLEECAICFEVMLRDQPLMALPCTHNFHIACIGPWVEERHTCPVCRRSAE